MKIPFNKPFLSGRELKNIRSAYLRGELAGDGYFTKKCQHWLEKNLGSKKAFLTHSCTSALEMAAILADIKPGDEVIMPSFTFVSTANAFVLRGGVPVFVDIRPDTLNIDENLIEKAITRKTKAIVPVHYAGVGCEMDIILKIARRHGLLVIEDAAHGLKATYKGKELGTMGDLGALSFHETKNIISGEGGALLVNNPKFIKRAEIVWQKGTDRSRFIRGEVDKYTWRDVGSSFLPGELIAAFLWAQLLQSSKITKKREVAWKYYLEQLKSLNPQGLWNLPKTDKTRKPNGHIFYILAPKKKLRNRLMNHLKLKKISCLRHYEPLHRSEFQQKLKKRNQLPITDSIAGRILRLPMFADLTQKLQKKICNHILKFTSE